MGPGGRLVVIGAGDVGGEVARRWVADGGEALGITSSPARHAALRSHGIEARVGGARELLRPEDRVLLSTPGSESQRRVAATLVGLGVGRSVMTGSTGIHGTPRGPVDESTPPGDGPRARDAAEAEAAFRRWAPDGVVLRLGGLYRSGRGPLQPLLRRGAPPLGPPDAALPLIHRADAVSAILAALVHPEPAPVYLTVTPPAPRRDEFYGEACRRHGLPEPLFSDPLGPGELDPRGAAGSPAGARRNSDEGSGRPVAWIDVSLRRRDLLPDPAHPDWREATRE